MAAVIVPVPRIGKLGRRPQLALAALGLRRRYRTVLVMLRVPVQGVSPSPSATPVFQ